MKKLLLALALLGFLVSDAFAGQTYNPGGSTSGGTPGGSSGQIQYNNAGAFGGDSGFTYNAGTVAITSFSTAGVVTNNSSGNLSSSANLPFAQEAKFVQAMSSVTEMSNFGGL